MCLNLAAKSQFDGFAKFHLVLCGSANWQIETAQVGELLDVS